MLMLEGLVPVLILVIKLGQQLVHQAVLAVLVQPTLDTLL